MMRSGQIPEVRGVEGAVKAIPMTLTIVGVGRTCRAV